MSSEINRYTLWLDSKYRSSGTNAVPEWELDPLTLTNPNNWFEVECLSAQIPFSFHQLSPPNNTLPYTIVSVTLSINVSGTLTIPSGNWNVLELLDRLGTLLTAALTNAGYQTNKLPTWDFTYDSVTSRCTLGIINVSTNHEVAVTLLWTQADLLAPFFGFDFTANTVLSYNNAAVVTSTNFVSPNAVNVSPATSLYLRSDSLNQQAGSQERLVEGVTTLTNIVARVPIETQANTVIQFQGTGLKNRVRGDVITAIQLYWTTTSYDAVFFEGINWQVCLQVTEQQPEWVTLLMRRAAEDQMSKQVQINQLLAERKQLLDKAAEEVEAAKKEVS